MTRINGAFRSYPIIIDVLLLLLVAIHALLTWKTNLPNVWEPLLCAESVRLDALFAGALNPAAIVAGFAGVVVVFGATAKGERFSNLRIEGGRALQGNWLSASMSGFISVAFSLTAIATNIAGLSWLSLFLFEAGAVILIHGSVRLLWIMNELVGIVRANDVKESGIGEPVEAESLFGKDDDLKN